MLWTPNSVSSRWVRIEANYAAHTSVPSKLVQARFDACDPPIAFSLIQFANLERTRPEASAEWSNLLNWLRDEGHPAAATSFAPPPVPAHHGTAPAAAPPPNNLPLFYHDLVPLSSSLHSRFKARTSDRAPRLATAHAIPLTIDEFLAAQRHFPIVFSSGDTPVPLALMGLNEGVNVFIDAEGRATSPVYIPAYVRRYPYLLAKLDASAEELSLCYDPTSDMLGEHVPGDPLFDNERPTETLNNILKFCEDFEVAAQRTSAFVKELQGLGLLIEGEVTIQPGDSPQPFLYRGFQMVDEEKFRKLGGDMLNWMNENGMLMLVTSHLSVAGADDRYIRPAAAAWQSAPPMTRAARAAPSGEARRRPFEFPLETGNRLII